MDTASYVHHLRPTCSQNRARLYAYAGSDFPHPIRFRFFKEGPDYTVQNRLGSDLDDLVRLSGSKPVCKNYRGPVLAERNWPATSFPLSDSVAFFHRRPGSYCVKQKQKTKTKNSQDPVWFWLTVSGFDRTDPVRKQAGEQESSGQLLANASEPTRMILTGMHAVGSGQSSFVVGSG